MSVPRLSIGLCSHLKTVFFVSTDVFRSRGSRLSQMINKKVLRIQILKDVLWFPRKVSVDFPESAELKFLVEYTHRDVSHGYRLKLLPQSSTWRDVALQVMSQQKAYILWSFHRDSGLLQQLWASLRRLLCKWVPSYHLIPAVEQELTAILIRHLESNFFLKYY